MPRIETLQAEISDFTSTNPENALRDRAMERFLAMKNQELEFPLVDEFRHPLHEMHVHQIELEIQNEELRLAQFQQETVRARYSDLYDLAPAGYCILGENGLILEANLTAATMLGMAKGALVSLSIHQLIFNEDQDIFYLHRKQLIETGIPQTFDLRMIKMDKTVFWARLNVTASQDSADNSVFLIMLSDITVRKQAEEALRVSEEKFRTVADFTYAMETWRTPDGKYQYVSPSCERITGYTVAEFLADPNLMIKISHPEDRPKVIEHYKAANRGAGTQNMGIDFRILTPNGNIRWIGHSCTAVHDCGGAPLGRRESNRDMTKRKQAEEVKEKLEVQNRLLQKAESLSRMAGAIAHHFNNKLHVVMGHLEMALDSLPQDEKSINNLTAAMQAADQAAEVSRSMLTYLGQVTGVRAPLDLSSICGRSLPLIQAALPKNLVFEMDLPSPGPTIIANSNQIQRILTNLISNSWEAVGDTQGKIQLTVKTVSSADISPLHRFPVNWQAEDKPYCCLEVRDTGCGIPDNDLDEVFDPFFSTKFTGRGLGLSVVLGVVQVHSGAVTIESTLDQGSVFRVFFPMSAEEVPFLHDDELKAPEIPWSGTILLVDDDEVILDISSTMLSMLGFEVLSARNGIEAVEIFQQRKDQILFVLTDFSMPRMNGLETLTALRQIAPGIPVILASGISEEQVMEGAHPELPQAFLEKPYGLNDLKDAIGRALAETKI